MCLFCFNLILKLIDEFCTFFDGIDTDLNHINELYPSLQTCHDCDEINRVFGNCSVNDFSVIRVNYIRSMGATGDALVGYLSLLHRKFDIVFLTETWV